MLAGWQSGYAEDCKSLYVGSIPVSASIHFLITLHMLFDSFAERDCDVYSSIVDNISDILDTCNHTNDGDNPYSFGVQEVSSISSGDIQAIINNIQKAIQKYEMRLKNVVVLHVKTENGHMIFQIIGEYEDENNNIKKLHFKKTVDIK